MAAKTRTENSILNINFSVISQLIKIVFSFVSRTVFIYTLGMEILGTNGVFASILSYLALSELGIGTAVTFTLYKPIAENDTEKIKSIVNFYRKLYKIIGLVILVAGMCVIPFLQSITADFILTKQLYIAYIIYVINIASTYLLFSYRQVLLVAHQKKHKIEKTNIVCYLLTNSLQIAFLLLFHNYIVYLVIQFFTQNLQQYWIYRVVGREYPYVNDKDCKKLEKADKKSIGNSVFSIAFFKVGAVILNSTDNIIISAFIGVAIVGIYSNYHLLISTVTGFIGLVFSSLTASVGNLNVSASCEQREKVFDKIFLVSTLLYGAGGMMLFQMLNPFISLWLGDSYVFSNQTVIVFIIDFMLAGFMIPIDTFKDACGVFKVGRYRPLLTVVINIVLSVILAQKMGITGIVLATSISRVCTTFWIDSRYTYRLIFKKRPLKYYLTFVKYFVLDCIGILILVFIGSYVSKLQFNPMINLIITFAYTSIFTIAFILVVYGRKTEFIELKNLALKMVKRRGHKNA